MKLTLSVEYVTNSDFYRVEVNVGDEKLFGERHTRLVNEGKRGEELIAALVADNRGGMISSVERFKNYFGGTGSDKYNHRSDGPNGEPAVMEFWKNGNFKTVQRFLNNQYEDSANGEHAIQHFTQKGEPAYSFSYKGGMRSPEEKEEEERWPSNQRDFNRVAAGRIAALEKSLREMQAKQSAKKRPTNNKKRRI